MFIWYWLTGVVLDKERAIQQTVIVVACSIVCMMPWVSMQVVDCGRFWAQDMEKIQESDSIQNLLHQYISQVQRSVYLTIIDTFIY